MGSLHLRACLAVLMALGSTAALAQGKSPTETVTSWSEAYASQDGARIASLYLEDASVWGTLSKAPTVGRAAIAGYFSQRREGVVSTSVTIDEQETKSLAADVALVFGRYTFRQKRSDGSEGSLPARFSFVIARGSDGLWRIAHHNSAPLPKPQ